MIAQLHHAESELKLEEEEILKQNQDLLSQI
jgi:hypothetical protein